MPEPTDYLKQALDSIPGKAELAAAAAGLEARKRTLSTPPNSFGTFRALAAEVMESVRSGEPVSPDLGQRALDAEGVTARWSAEKRVLDLASLTLESDQADWLQAGSESALQGLKGHLQPLLDRAREALPSINGVFCAEDAIDAGPETSTAWAEFTFLAREYRSLRQAQRQLVLNAVGGTGGMGSFVQFDASESFGLKDAPLEDVLNRVGEIRNYGELYPDWIMRRIARSRSRDATYVEPLAFDFAGDPFAHLRKLIADSAVDIWLPTLGEAKAAYAEVYRIGKQYQAQAEKDDPSDYLPSHMSEGQLDQRLAGLRAAAADRDPNHNYLTSYPS